MVKEVAISGCNIVVGDALYCNLRKWDCSSTEEQSLDKRKVGSASLLSPTMICSGCRRHLRSSDFHKKREGISRKCKRCSAKYHAKWYSKNRAKRIAQVAKAVAVSRRSRRTLIDQTKSVSCADCNNTFPTICMDFDHVRGEKSFSIGSVQNRNVSVAKLKEEIAKCDVVCANCHRIRTFNRRNQT